MVTDAAGDAANDDKDDSNDGKGDNDDEVLSTPHTHDRRVVAFPLVGNSQIGGAGRPNGWDGDNWLLLRLP